MTSTNLREAFLGPQHAVYPQIDQVCRISGPSIQNISPTTYPGFVVQFNGTTPRDREPCYITEPNGIPVGTGYILGDLVSSFNGLPLYAVSCCIPPCCACSHTTNAPVTVTISGCGDCMDGEVFTLASNPAPLAGSCLEWAFQGAATNCIGLNYTCVSFVCWPATHDPPFSLGITCFNPDGACIIPTSLSPTSINCEPLQVVFQVSGKGNCNHNCIVTVTQ